MATKTAVVFIATAHGHAQIRQDFPLVFQKHSPRILGKFHPITCGAVYGFIVLVFGTNGKIVRAQFRIEFGVHRGIGVFQGAVFTVETV